MIARKLDVSERRAMARDVIIPGEVAQRTEMIEIRCGRCDRVGRLRTARLWGGDKVASFA